MPRYKILRVYIIDAPSRIDARNAFGRAMANDKEDEYLESVTIKELEPEKPAGWGSTLKEQLTGKSTKR